MKKLFCFWSQPIIYANDEISLVKNHRSRPLIGRTMFFSQEKSDRTASHVILAAKTGNSPRCRKGLWTLVQFTGKRSHIKKKTQRDVKLLQTLLGTRNELRKIEESPALAVKRIHLRVIISVRTKDKERLWAFFAPKSVGKFLSYRC